MYKNKWIPILFLLPTTLFLVVFLIYPFAANIINSFYKSAHVLDPSPTFVGIDNYISLFTAKEFQQTLLNTLYLVGVVIVFQVGVALILALMVNSIKKLNTFYKVSFFLPIVISATALGLMFNMFYEPRGGLFNQILAIFNLRPVVYKDVYNLPKMFAFITAPVVWQYVGFYFVIFLTGLSTIPNELLEASEIDGATGLQKVFKIQLPMLQNITRVVIVLAITGTLKVFDLPHIINSGGRPNGRLHFLGTYMYEKAFVGNTNLGYAAALAVVLVFAGVGLSLIANLLFRPNKDI
ncbi:MAG: sugar ABC transporter permease [Acholeplasmataceae bacterium]|nr:sugar ABC transporter permease [Acholeplasmataceae bacterium]